MELNIPLAFNPSHISQELLDTFPFDAVRYLLVNETEAYEIPITQHLRKLLNLFWRNILLYGWS